MQRSAALLSDSVNYDSLIQQTYVSRWENPASQREAPSPYRVLTRCRSYPSCSHKLDVRNTQFDRLSRGATLSRLQTRFDELALRWKRETRAMSSSTQILSNESFRRIIGLGENVLPMIFDQLTKSHDLDWIEALSEITGFQLVIRTSSADDLLEGWLDWGRENRLVD